MTYNQDKKRFEIRDFYVLIKNVVNPKSVGINVFLETFVSGKECFKLRFSSIV